MPDYSNPLCETVFGRGRRQTVLDGQRTMFGRPRNP